MKIIAILLSLPAILFAGQEILLSPLYNCFVENFSPSKGTSRDCFSCLLEVKTKLTSLHVVTLYPGPTTGQPRAVERVHTEVPADSAQFLFGGGGRHRGVWRDVRAPGVFGGKSRADGSREMPRTLSELSGGGGSPEWSCLHSTNSTKRNHCCWKVSRS